jgi:hypothetical protein
MTISYRQYALLFVLKKLGMRPYVVKIGAVVEIDDASTQNSLHFWKLSLNGALSRCG